MCRKAIILSIWDVTRKWLLFTFVVKKSNKF